MSRVVVVLVTAAIAVSVAQSGFTDTVGGSTDDWQTNGPTLRWLVGSAPWGCHSVWMYSNDTSQTFPDRNMRYNFYPYVAGQWNWIDPDYMLSGVNVFSTRSGFGSLAADDSTGIAVISCHQGSYPISPTVARDAAAGAGIFEYCPGEPTIQGYLWPVVGTTPSGRLHLAFIDDATQDAIYYSHSTSWCTWTPPIPLGPPDPTFPTHNLATSRQSNTLCATWVVADANWPYHAYYRVSTDDGQNWGPVTELPAPPAFGPDTTVSYYITSPFPFYHADGDLHVVVDVMPVVHDTAYPWPSEIWHWCAANNPQWSRIHRANGRPPRELGYNALIACRPSIGEDSDGNLFVSWEEFDTANVEPLTRLHRADVWADGSTDNGRTWGEGVKLTSPNSTSKRFPCAIDVAIPGYGSGDTAAIQYYVDEVAGASLYQQGPATYNPVVVCKIAVSYLLFSGAAESPTHAEPGLSLTALPNPVQGRCVISYSVPTAGNVSLVVYDASGRLVRTLASGRQAAGRYSVGWTGDDAAPGIYFCSLVAGTQTITRKVVLSR